MWEEDESPQFQEGDMVRWRDPAKAAEYGSGPFRVVASRPVQWAPICSCGESNQNLLEGKHQRYCEMNFSSIRGYAVILDMNGRYRSFPEEWLRLA